MTTLDWTHLQTFAAVAERGSLSEAARGLRSSQPTMGRHIRALETELGTRLFERTAAGFELTPTGTELLVYARDMNNAANRLLLSAEGRSETVAGTIRITASEIVATYVLPDIKTLSSDEMETPGAPLPELDWQRASRIQEFLPENEGDALLKVQSIVENFVYMPRHDLSEEQQANPTVNDYSWYAVFPKSTFRIVDLEVGAGYILELLKARNLPLVGSFSLASFEDNRTERRKTYGDLGHVCGTMKINWFRFANAYVEGMN